MRRRGARPKLYSNHSWLFIINIFYLHIFYASVIFFFIILGFKSDADPPIVRHGDETPVARDYINPLPHTLMLTAIVVSVSTTGVALALLIRIHRRYGTLDETELIEKLK